MSDFDFAELQADLESASKLALAEISTAYPDEVLCAFSLYSDSGAMTACVTVNTVSNLKRHQDENPDDQAYYKFSPAEWHYELQGAQDEVSQICRRLYAAVIDNEDEEWLERFRESLFETCVKALENLRNEGVFSHLGSDFLLVFAVSDSDPDPMVELANLSRLNSEANINELKAWQQTWCQ